MVDMSRALSHLAWADEVFFTQFASLPEAAMGARYAPDQWPAGHLAAHIIGSASWYRYCLTGEPWLDVTGVRTPADLGALLPDLLAMDAALLAQAQLPDEPVTFADEDGERTVLRSTLLNQACLHAVEHRAQISAALAASGFAPISLDDLDFWAFEEHSSAG
jgi:uncharacterized damage-inducible protein DinB